VTRLRRYAGDLKLSTKLFLSCLLICITPLALLGLYSYNQANDFLNYQARQNTLLSVQQIADDMNARNLQTVLVTNSIIKNFIYQKIFSGQPVSENYADYVDPFFNNVLYTNKGILQISVFTDNKRLWHGEYILDAGLIKSFPWYEDALSTDGVTWYSKNGKLICVTSFAQRNGTPAILFLSIDTDSLFNGSMKSQPENSGAVVTDQNGTVIVRKDGRRGAGIDPAKLTYNDNFTYFQSGGVDYLAVKSVVKTPGWNLYYYVPVRDISIDAARIAKVTVIITAVCLVLLVLLIWGFSTTFAKRLKHLNQLMETVEKGDLGIEIVDQSKDEIGELTSKFGLMVRNLRALIDEVYHSRLIQKEAELKALQSQINPHFLYNTLSLINWKAIQIDATEISQVTNTVSGYYRTVLNKGKNTTSIRDEVHNAELYMQLQLLMHDNRFDFDCDVDEALLGYEIVNLVLQPLLENALDHGLDKRRKPSGRGLIRLCGRSIDGDVELSVADNGAGMPEHLVKEVLTQDSKGYGLKNVNERIALFFGEKYGLRIVSEPGAGTTVYIRIPKSRQACPPQTG
jgi:two-component system sensor histidine kinase YesM